MSGGAVPCRRLELVVMHSGPGDPSGTAAWLAARPALTRHHHVRVADAKHMARLARWMAGQVSGGSGDRPSCPNTEAC